MARKRKVADPGLKETESPHTERIALAILIGLIFGILMTRVGAVALDNAMQLWAIMLLAMGIILEPTWQRRIGRLSLLSLLGALAPVLGGLGYIVVRYLASAVIGFVNGVAINLSGVEMSPSNLVEALPRLLTLAGVAFLGTFLALGLATASGRLLLTGATRIFRAGPESVDKLRAILMAFAGVIAAVSAVWSVFIRKAP